MSIDTQPAAQAVEALIHQYGRLVFQVIYGLIGDWHESQDLTQDTFVQAFKAIQTARAGGLKEAAVHQRLSRTRKLFQKLYLLGSGEAIADGSSLTLQEEQHDRRFLLPATSPPALAASL